MKKKTMNVEISTHKRELKKSNGLGLIF